MCTVGEPQGTGMGNTFNGMYGLTCTNVNSLQLRLLPTEGREVIASKERTPRPNTPQERYSSDRQTPSSSQGSSIPALT